MSISSCFRAVNMQFEIIIKDCSSIYIIKQLVVMRLTLEAFSTVMYGSVR